MVNKENMLKWVQALESGEYEQGKNALCTVAEDGSKKFCCLGVATEVAIADGVVLERKQDHDLIGYRIPDDAHAEAANLPGPVVRWLKVGSRNVSLGYTKCSNASCSDPSCRIITATQANDELGMSFMQIAARLREFYQL